MNENKLIKLLDLALERIDYLEAEAIDSREYEDALDKGSEVLDQKVKELEKENENLQHYFEKANAEASELFEEVNLLKKVIEEKDGAIFELESKLEKVVDQRNELVLETANAGELDKLKKENEKLSNKNRQLQADVKLLDDKVHDMMKNVSFTKTKWNDILDPTKRPRPNEPVLITTKSGKIIIGSFEVDGSIRSSGKPTKAKAWMALPKAFE